MNTINGMSLSYLLVFSILVVAAMYAVKLLDDRRTPFDEDEGVRDNNIAIALRKGGIYLGMAIGVAGAFTGASQGLFWDLVNFAVELAFLMVALFVAFQLNDKVLLSRVNNDEAVASGNVAVGLVELASYISSGLIINGALTGEGGGIVVAAVFFVLGQVALIILFWAYQAIKKHLGDSIGSEGSLNDAFDLFGMLIGFSLILRASIVGPFTGWVSDLKSFGYWAGIGLVLILVFELAIIRPFFLPKTNSHKRSLAPAILSACILIGVAKVIANLM